MPATGTLEDVCVLAGEIEAVRAIELAAPRVTGDTLIQWLAEDGAAVKAGRSRGGPRRRGAAGGARPGPPVKVNDQWLTVVGALQPSPAAGREIQGFTVAGTGQRHLRAGDHRRAQVRHEPAGARWTS